VITEFEIKAMNFLAVYVRLHKTFQTAHCDIPGTTMGISGVTMTWHLGFVKPCLLH